MSPKKNFKNSLMHITIPLDKTNLCLKKEENLFRLPTLTLQGLSIYIIVRSKENKLMLLIKKLLRLGKSL